MDHETPAQLLGRLKLGREEFCQRLLTSLVLGGPYPRWNTRSRPTGAGIEFLRRLHTDCFAGPWPGDDLEFVDEFELPARHDAEAGGWPDYGVLWTDRVWLIELKTEKGSHRRDQIPSYFDLAQHHHPDAAVDFLYLTSPMVVRYDARVDGHRFAHRTWADVLPLITSIWPIGADPTELAIVDGLIDAVENLDTSPGHWRRRSYPTAAGVALEPTPPKVADKATVEVAGVGVPSDALEEALRLAGSTAGDGRQRAIDIWPGDLGELMALRLAIRNRLAASPPDSTLRHVVAWIWRPESSGRALTPAGAELGMELRLSRYSVPQYS